MHKSREAPRQGHASLARRKTLQHHWLISPAWRYALSTFDLLEEGTAPFIGADGREDR